MSRLIGAAPGYIGFEEGGKCSCACYSRLSISSKMSKSSSQTIAMVPPPVPTDPPPQVHHSRDSLSSTPSPLSEPSPSAPETTPPSPPPTARQATRAVPPPLILPSNQLGPEPPDFVTATSSPLLHTNFSSPQSSPLVDPTTVAVRSPMSDVFDYRGSGTTPALHQRIESDREIGSPLANFLLSTAPEAHTFEQFQSVVVKDTEDKAVSAVGGMQPQSPPHQL